MTFPLKSLVEAASTAPIVPVLVVDRIEMAAPLARALVDGGLTIAEVTLRTPSGLAVIEEMKSAEPGLKVGAGTVLTEADVDNALSAGSDFLVSPGMSPKLLAGLGNRRRLMIPGVATASEAMSRHEEGFDLLKLFPATIAGGVGALKAIAGPLPHLRFMPTGGITEADAGKYVALPNVVAVGGSWIATGADIAAEDWKGISAKARKALAAI
ncbi:MAG: bifunctional 4-hydroxy-2-oxoglutarate aldolase/2-dehydro-3-deoxy-phosphogluconate aldolase [Alphaproteobacteria bacterium]|nr:bifunctional 4-hydroxy-2-oxoglutarate aldolase/2-dehydro-3-deoxy-phosphogluconate aldolase [Alphaproteobacteria bacterium]MBU2085595.1 bifunctional 4-hydroxy-2-oxoglutarate aldolase/2-dehydro-3-deoxy-phosphogluconate aldolase [Alphaproteobacteria bacterium]MBU2141833.1 bifunctional 4-hydroxy-2-oxoglutarate aldolase/2-dehydro-3-deoxy-phosphogluconate aldolase [Alphaproteobacteria bacterium]MBU2195795.1 bifunctional 4-hydroxy-2-oxoglutarate aldolase/2-dehydro-3-deoxy-phosphogluconate aldolase [